MNVGELIEELKKMPPEMIVLVNDRVDDEDRRVWAQSVKQERLVFNIGVINKEHWIDMGALVLYPHTES